MNDQALLPTERGFYWVAVPDMVPQIAFYDPEEQAFGGHGEPWAFTWGSYRWPDRIKAISGRLQEPVNGTQVGGMPDVNYPALRRRRAELAEACADYLVGEGAEPNIDSALDTVGSVFQVLRRRFGIEVAGSALATSDQSEERFAHIKPTSSRWLDGWLINMTSIGGWAMVHYPGEPPFVMPSTEWHALPEYRPEHHG